MLKISKLEKNIDYTFNDKSLLRLSLTHPSYAHEHNIQKYETNQRLEFLGDAVLELISSDFLYKYYDKENEGTLTKKRANLVCAESLSYTARKLNLHEYMLLGNGENKNHIYDNDKIMCDTLEALIGAIYIDSNYDVTSHFVHKFILNTDNLKKITVDYKSIIQERANHDKAFLRYDLINEFGPDHDKTFIVKIHYGNSITEKGVGKTKKEAEQNAAKIALDRLL